MIGKFIVGFIVCFIVLLIASIFTATFHYLNVYFGIWPAFILLGLLLCLFCGVINVIQPDEKNNG